MDELEIAVLELLLFPEHFNNIVAECKVKVGRHAIGDALKTLLHDKYVSPLRLVEDGKFERSIGYDSDNMEAFHYQITAKGIDTLNNILKRQQ